MPIEKSADIVVVGAGPVGSACAAFLAEAGLAVLLVEKKRLNRAGPHWVNGFPDWVWPRVSLPAPEPPEYLGTGGAVGLVGADDRLRVTVSGTGCMDVDMRRLMQRLHGLCRSAGARIMEKTQLEELVLAGERPVRAVVRRALRNGRAERTTLAGSLFVDATGLASSVRKHVPALQRYCPAVPGHDLCSAAQEDLEVSDRDAAEACLNRMGATTDVMNTWTGISGGYSIQSINLAPDLERVSLLTGTIADGRHGSGRELMASLKLRLPWLGQTIHYGEGLIPIRRTRDLLVSEGIALMGDSACMAFPAHASAISNSFIAARILADCLAGSGDPGALETVWDYQHRYMVERGSVCGASDVFRRFSQSNSAEANFRLLNSGLIDVDGSRDVLAQKFPNLGRATAFRALKAAKSAPRTALSVLPVGARTALAYLLYRSYPRRPSLRRLSVWSETLAAILGHRPDIRFR